MTLRSFAAVLMTATLASLISAPASAGSPTCESGNGTTLRHWMVVNAYACEEGKGNPEVSADIEAVGAPFNFESWQLDEDITANQDDSEWLNIEFVAGNWNEGSIFATWELAPGFWDTHGVAVITLHVGDRSDESLDDFATFIITPGESSGTIVFAQVTAEGAKAVKGGLAEVRLWTPTVGVTGSVASR